MHFVKPDAELIVESNPFKLIEKVGRLCYRSEEKITDTSCYSFVKGLITRKHYAMLEHARVTFEMQVDRSTLNEYFGYMLSIPYIHTFVEEESDNVINWIMNVSVSHLFNDRWNKFNHADSIFGYLRSILINNYVPEDVDSCEWYQEQCFSDYDYQAYEFTPGHLTCDIIDGDFLCKTDPYYNEFKYATVRFICDRGVTHEFVRHRCAAAQESTRYCNYTKDKFGNGDLEFVEPSDFESWDGDCKILFKQSLRTAEDTYNYMTSENMSAQQARAVLPHAIKAGLILTMNINQWKHFFDLRYFGTTGAPHPDAKVAAGKAYDVMKEAGILG